MARCRNIQKCILWRNQRSKNCLHELPHVDYLKVFHCLVALNALKDQFKHSFTLVLGRSKRHLEQYDEVEQVSDGDAEDPLPLATGSLDGDVNETEERAVASS